MESDAPPFSARPPTHRRIRLGALLPAIFCSCAGLAADFAPGDRIELIKDTPLYFGKTTIVRTGKSGELFTVIAARPDGHRLFLSAQNALGKEIALNVGDDAVVLIKKGVTAAGSKDVMEAMESVQKDLTAARKIPGRMTARTSDATRWAAMQETGGSRQGDAAVVRGLRWLKENQNPDGSWGPAYRGAMTGFAVLCFLGRDETPQSAEYGPTMQRAIDWLIDNGSKHEGRLSMSDSFDQSGVYEHAIATCALGEYYTMTKDERVVDLFKKAVAYIVEGQGPDGGWMYSYDKTQSDTSVSGWQIQALTDAHLSGLNIDGVDGAMDRAMLNLKRVQAEDGSFGYRRPTAGSYSLTGAGVFCSYFWKQEKDKSVRDGIDFLLKQTSKEHPVDYRHVTADLYAWYYNTQACFMVGGTAWQKWNSLFQGQLVRNQSPDGSWPPTAGKSPGGEIQRDPDGAGPCYRTCLCILMLEVYYRYSRSVR